MVRPTIDSIAVEFRIGRDKKKHLVAALKADIPPERLTDLAELREIVGFPAYDAAEKRYEADD